MFIDMRENIVFFHKDLKFYASPFGLNVGSNTGL